MPLDRQTIAHDPIHEQHLGHGNTVASWAMFTIMFVGFLLSCVAFTIPNWVLFWAGGVIFVVGIIAGLVLKAAGFGVGGSRTKHD
ncbi:hypothetical protein MHJ63_05595 [Pseudoglutamicibacter albus]|uniref:HGxxPAAW family protein n=1 Tax=Pseudoglutamicibacter albus TaxID=98671 RepID=UPI001EF51BE9|nr:HGxxPAAW family protein [Pseudoglutamicibacter albus]MCG7304750.1 hypothetical protein [Pseudoglutamicibacter albus]